MKIISLMSPYISTLFNLYAFLKAYEVTIKHKVTYKFINIVLFLITAVIIIISNTFFPITLKVTISILILLINYKIIFKENLISTLFKTFIIYITLLLCDFLVSTIFLFFPISSVVELGKITIIRDLCTILDSLLLLLVFLTKSFVRFINKLLSYITDKQNVIILILAFSAFVLYIILGFLSAVSFSLTIYLISLLLVIFLLFLVSILIVQYFKNKTSKKEQESLLTLMNEYEKLLDNERENRHEMLNNLVILKSYKNKKGKEYERILDEIISIYEGNKSQIYTKLYKLPSGVKGIIYYKMSQIKSHGIELNLVISNDVKDRFENIIQKEYYKVCKILGILIDNAIEAASVTEEKSLLIDIYYDDDLIIYIENSFKEIGNIEEIYKKGYSSKGKNRGLGLYIVSKIIKECDVLELEQYVDNNKFVSVLKVKNPSFS